MPHAIDRVKRREAVPAHKRLSGMRPSAEHVRMALIDEPQRAMRETMDEGKLEELIESMRELGLIEPIAVQRAGARYRVLAGHRRYVAAKALQWSTIQCMVYPAELEMSEAIKAHENTIREDVNPAEEAAWLAAVLESECGGDTIILAQRLGMRQDYLEERLKLKTGDPEVFAAVARREIGVGVARELNLVRDPIRRGMLLQVAVDGGCSVKQMERWRTEGNAIDLLNPQAPLVEARKEQDHVYMPVPIIECFFCGAGPADGAIQTLYVHGQCMRHFRREVTRIEGQRSEQEE